MRCHNNEHSDTLPTIDVTALKHVAYVLDALVYYMRSGTDHDAGELATTRNDATSPAHSWNDADESTVDPDAGTDGGDDAVNHSVAMEIESCDGDADWSHSSSGRKHTFFQRSNSTTFLGCPPPDPFHTPLLDALPLAERPQLLTPNARKEDIFGMPRRTVAEATCSGYPPPFDRLPTHVGLSRRTPGSTLLHSATAPASLASAAQAAVAVEVPPCVGQSMASPRLATTAAGATSSSSSSADAFHANSATASTSVTFSVQPPSAAYTTAYASPYAAQSTATTVAASPAATSTAASVSQSANTSYESGSITSSSPVASSSSSTSVIVKASAAPTDLSHAAAGVPMVVDTNRSPAHHAMTSQRAAAADTDDGVVEEAINLSTSARDMDTTSSLSSRSYANDAMTSSVAAAGNSGASSSSSTSAAPATSSSQPGVIVLASGVPASPSALVAVYDEVERRVTQQQQLHLQQMQQQQQQFLQQQLQQQQQHLQQQQQQLQQLQQQQQQQPLIQEDVDDSDRIAEPEVLVSAAHAPPPPIIPLSPSSIPLPPDP